MLSGLNWRRLLYLVIGFGLFALALRDVDLGEVWGQIAKVGLWGSIVVCTVHLVAFLLDTAAWQRALPSTRLTPGWLYSLWKARMVGEAFNVIVPAASFGGEPVKALILKRHHGIGYREGGASVILQRTIILLSMTLFFGIGVAIMLVAGTLPRAYELLAATAWLALSLGIFGFFAVQRWAVASRAARIVARWPLARRLEGLLEEIESVEDLFKDFYSRRPRDFALALVMTFGNWVLFAVEIKVIVFFLGASMTWSEAWLLATLVELIRAGLFLIPGGLGAVEIGFVTLVQIMTGAPALGLAIALVRRGRELLFIAWGLLIGWRYPSFAPAPQGE
ncbi:MAG: flippase-like domain-containing protein [Kiloniellales bacterium]|nr:flippase-like domain-containing protein [Kiloniellales bacterium]